jgi:hypothetical protein
MKDYKNIFTVAPLLGRKCFRKNTVRWHIHKYVQKNNAEDKTMMKKEKYS